MAKHIEVATVKPNCVCLLVWSLMSPEGFFLNWESTFVGYYQDPYYGCGGGYYFAGVNIPQGAEVINAQLRLMSADSVANRIVRSEIWAQINANPQPFSTFDDYISRPWYPSEANCDDIPPLTSGTWYTTPNFADIVQQIVNLPDWKPGNPMVIVWSDFDCRSDPVTGTFRAFFTPYHEPPTPIILVIDYEPPRYRRTYLIKHPALMSIKTVEHTKQGDKETTHLSDGSSLAERRLTTSKEITITPPAEVEVTTLPGLKYTKEIR